MWKDPPDVDESFSAVHTFTILFVPIFRVARYRVKNAPTGGWFFLEKQSLNSADKNFNYISALIIFIGAMYFRNIYK